VINNLPAMIEAGGKLIASIGEGLATGLTTVTEFGVKIAAELAAAVGNNLAVLAQVGANMVVSLWEGAKAKFAEFIAWIATIPSQIVAAFGNIDLSNAIKWPSIPEGVKNFLGFGSSAPGASSGTKSAPAPATDPMGNPLGGGFNPTSNTGGSIGGSNGFTKTAANQNVAVGGRIVVEAAEGTRVVNVQSTNPAVPVTPNRGSMLGRA
jgi:hypothetical protein